MTIRWIAIVSVVLLCGCAGEPTPYQRAGTASAGGYSERRISEDTFYVSYRANSRTPGNVLCAYLFRRAAELTRRYGFHYFAVIRGPRQPTHRETRYPDALGTKERREPIDVEMPVPGEVFMTIQCFKAPPAPPETRVIIDAKGYLEKNPHPWK
ncbi:MAG: hypothetical protein NTZ17_14225 [Phycisphaerae bacterium]|nr:hypothetical protein [Phycisphaerae bacterium]